MTFIIFVFFVFFFLFYLLGCLLVGRFVIFVGCLCFVFLLWLYGFFCLVFCLLVVCCDLYYLDFCEFFFVDYILISITFKCDAVYMLILLCINITFCFVIFYAMYYLFFDHLLIRFLVILTLFVTWMNMFLLAFDFLTAYIAWEFIGLFSFFLISYFWFRYYALKCGFKAFFIGKLGDLSLFVSCILIYKHTGFMIVSFFYINTLYDYYFIVYLIITIILCASTKSTQFGLHIWLPDAMEGPIPVSALIHAATLVVCGILLTSFIFTCFEFWISNLYFLMFWALCLLLLNAISTLNNFDVKLFELLYF